MISHVIKTCHITYRFVLNPAVCGSVAAQVPDSPISGSVSRIPSPAGDGAAVSGNAAWKTVI